MTQQNISISHVALSSPVTSNHVGIAVATVVFIIGNVLNHIITMYVTGYMYCGQLASYVCFSQYLNRITHKALLLCLLGHSPVFVVATQHIGSKNMQKYTDHCWATIIKLFMSIPTICSYKARICVSPQYALLVHTYITMQNYMHIATICSYVAM